MENRILTYPSTKLRMPAVSETCLKRPRLTALFRAALSHRVILVSAPGGYGKTTFLCQELSEMRTPVAWISLDKSDSQLSGFWSGLIMAIRATVPGFGEGVLSMLRRREQSVESAVTVLVNEIAQSVPEITIVLDDYHEVRNEAIHHSLVRFIKYLPPNAHVIIAGRSDPPLPLASLRGRGHVAGIGAADLQFTKDECQAFLGGLMGIDLSPTNLARVYARTEGWVAALQMLVVSLRGRRDVSRYIDSFAGTNEDVAEYLSQEVLKEQAESVRSFLLETCILDRLSASLCNAVRGRADSQGILEWLAANHIFTQRLDNEGQWFRYQHLFADLLRRQLSMLPPNVVLALHARASQWFEGVGLLENAIDHALAAEDFDRAGRLIDRIAPAIVGQDKQFLLGDWLTRLPQGLAAKSVWMCQAGLVNLDIHRQLDGAESYFHYAEALDRSAKEAAEKGAPLSDTALGILARIKAFSAYHAGDITGAIALASEALQSLPEDEGMARCTLNHTLGRAYWAKGDLMAAHHCFERSVRLAKGVNWHNIAIHGTCHLAHIRYAWGHLNSAAEACREAIQLATAEGSDEVPASLYAHLLLGQIFYQWDQLNESRDHIAAAIDLSERNAEPLVHLNGHMAMARLLLVQRKGTEAMEVARRAKIAYEARPGHRPLADIFLTRLCLMAGDVRAASDRSHVWACSFPEPGEDLPQWAESLSLSQYSTCEKDIRDVWSETALLTLARLRLAEGRTQGLTELLDAVCREAEAKQFCSVLIEALILKALVLNSERKVVDALLTLKQALSITEREGYVRVFIDEGRPMFELLQRAARQGVHGHYVSGLLAAFKGSHPVPLKTAHHAHSEAPAGVRTGEEAGPLIEPLSARESEILKFISDGASNQQIADALSIALFTVKNHVHHIFVKLDVDNRTSALRRARELGLLKDVPQAVNS